jgi:CRP-like cAMP-binding protein
VLAILLPRDTFNEVTVFDGGPNPAGVETLAPPTILAVPDRISPLAAAALGR